ncbi:MAG: glutamate N-acetyltransferase / amino-acid N-acetyltransferase [Acidimicrobiia bacterium]|jgi:glutamate N-acetyltransferase/amino-acid N-acetyltransferase|nr:glutamate N-acetyltransferase / amino-acid N-acetyltransferase [Acidimicrobiia bacterium]
MNAVPLPRGFRAHVANVGIKDTTDDFVVVASDRPCNSAAVFTKSRFAGASVVISRAHAQGRNLRAAVVISKNANVATGAQGEADAREVVGGVADALEVSAEQVLIASTGVIGRPYPMDPVRAGLKALSAPFGLTDAVAVARAIMTTDTHPKVASAAVGDARVVGVAKGVGMIEPDMATMIALIFTDAEVPADDLDDGFRQVVAKTFNSLSVDTDTSTSDTAAVLANGAAGPVDVEAFRDALAAVCLDLTRQLARDGEGATRLLLVTVDGARDDDQARRVAKSILNSPLVKTAVHGADPNWGRVAMAVGKCADDLDIDENRVVIRFGTQEVYPGTVDDAGLERLSAYMSGDEVVIHVSLGIAGGAWTVYGCDLSDGYVRINADYTT